MRAGRFRQRGTGRDGVREPAVMRMAALLLRTGLRRRDELRTALEAEAERVWQLLSGRPGARVRVMELLDGVVDGSSHALAMGGRPFDAEIEAGWGDAPPPEAGPGFAGPAGRPGGRPGAG